MPASQLLASTGPVYVWPGLRVWKLDCWGTPWPRGGLPGESCLVHFCWVILAKSFTLLRLLVFPKKVPVWENTVRLRWLLPSCYGLKSVNLEPVQSLLPSPD